MLFKWSNYYICQINDASSDEEIREICWDCLDMLCEAGFMKPPAIMKLDDKHGLVRTLSLHHIILRSKAELDQLKEGLSSAGVLEILQKHPQLLKTLFTSEGLTPLTPGTLSV